MFCLCRTPDSHHTRGEGARSQGPARPQAAPGARAGKPLGGRAARPCQEDGTSRHRALLSSPSSRRALLGRPQVPRQRAASPPTQGGSEGPEPVGQGSLPALSHRKQGPAGAQAAPPRLALPPRPQHRPQPVRCRPAPAAASRRPRRCRGNRRPAPVNPFPGEAAPRLPRPPAEAPPLPASSRAPPEGTPPRTAPTAAGGV